MDSKQVQIPGIRDIDLFLDFLPYLKSKDSSFYELVDEAPQFPYYVYSPEIVDLITLINQQNMFHFDWVQWSSEASNYLEDPLQLENANLTTVMNLLFTMVRAERFTEGLMGEMVDKGIVLKLLLRLEKIRSKIIDGFYGALLGLAIADSMGAPLEFKNPGSFQPVNGMTGGGTHNLSPGMWTDDTSMALCLAESLIEKGDFDPIDQLQSYLRWFQEGYLSVNGHCFDIGNTTREALRIFQETGEPYPGLDHELSAGNGSLMRLAPVPLFYFTQPGKTIELSGQSSRTTHNHILAVDACRYMGSLINGALVGFSKEELLSPHFSIVPGYWDEHPLAEEIDEVASGSYQEKEPPEIRGRGYVVKSLEAALWAFHQSESFREGCLLAVNLGEDADTTGAIYGQLAGAFYGKSGIPSEWIEKLACKEMIHEKIKGLLAHQM